MKYSKVQFLVRHAFQIIKKNKNHTQIYIQVSFQYKLLILRYAAFNNPSPFEKVIKYYTTTYETSDLLGSKFMCDTD